MADITLEDRFHGTCNLAILHLRRAAKSNDLERGFEAARSMGMLKPEHESFIRECLEADRLLQAGKPPRTDISDATIKEMQACILRLNTADPA